METIVIKATPSKKSTTLANALAGAGFDKVTESSGKILCEKFRVEDLKGTNALNYSITFGTDSISLAYSVSSQESKHKRLFEVLPVFFDSLLIASSAYHIDAGTLLSYIHGLITQIEPLVDKDALDTAQALSESVKRYDALSSRYQELVRSSEENTRILLECERRRDELESRVRSLESLSDESLKEELYKWVVAHNGSIDLEQFCTAYHVPYTRAEEGIALLIKEGYLKRV